MNQIAIRKEWRRQDQIYSVGEEANEWRLAGTDLAARALQRAMAFTEAKAAAVVLVARGEKRLIACEGCVVGTDLPFELFGLPEVQRVFDGETVILNPPFRADDRLSILAVPLKACGQVIGAIVLGKPGEDGVFFVDERRAVTTIAALVAPHLCEEAGRPALCPTP